MASGRAWCFDFDVRQVRAVPPRHPSCRASLGNRRSAPPRRLFPYFGNDRFVSASLLPSALSRILG